jgi:hypothetical protein
MLVPLDRRGGFTEYYNMLCCALGQNLNADLTNVSFFRAQNSESSRNSTLERSHKQLIGHPAKAARVSNGYMRQKCGCVFVLLCSNFEQAAGMNATLIEMSIAVTSLNIRLSIESGGAIPVRLTQECVQTEIGCDFEYKSLILICCGGHAICHFTLFRS